MSLFYFGWYACMVLFCEALWASWTLDRLCPYTASRIHSIYNYNISQQSQGKGKISFCVIRPGVDLLWSFCGERLRQAESPNISNIVSKKNWGTMPGFRRRPLFFNLFDLNTLYARTHLFQDNCSRSFHALVIVLNVFNTQQAGKLHLQILKCIMGDLVAITVEPLWKWHCLKWKLPSLVWLSRVSSDMRHLPSNYKSSCCWGF